MACGPIFPPLQCLLELVRGWDINSDRMCVSTVQNDAILELTNRKLLGFNHAFQNSAFSA
jgi:hypothetical protein